MKLTKKFYLIIPIVMCAITLTAVYATGTVETFNAPWQLKDSSNNQTRMYVDSSGNVGVGTTTPQAKLDVSGGVVTRSQVPAVSFMGDISGARWIQGLGGYMLSFYSDNSNQNGLGGTVSYNGETWV